MQPMAKGADIKHNQKGVIYVSEQLKRGIVLYCEHCKVEFKVWIEPAYSVDTVISEFPSSLEWLKEIRSGMGQCPVCIGILEVKNDDD